MKDKPYRDRVKKKPLQKMRRDEDAQELPEVTHPPPSRPSILTAENLLEIFSRANRLIRSEADATSLCAQFLTLCLEAFACDQAWILFQSDIQDGHWNLGFFRSIKPDDGAISAGRSRLSPELNGFFQAAFILSQPTSFTSGNHRPIPEKLVERFGSF